MRSDFAFNHCALRASNELGAHHVLVEIHSTPLANLTSMCEVKQGETKMGKEEHRRRLENTMRSRDLVGKAPAPYAHNRCNAFIP